MGSRLLTIKELSEAGIGSRSYVYKLLASGRLRAVKAGRRTLFRREDVEAFLAEMPAADLGRREVK